MTDINIDDYITYINTNNNIKGEKCMICHMNDTIDNLVKLSCNHYFHRTCLPKKNTIKCLYCNKKTKLQSTKKVTNNNNICKVILKSGKNKGKHCNRINCGYHKTK